MYVDLIWEIEDYLRSQSPPLPDRGFALPSSRHHKILESVDLAILAQTRFRRRREMYWFIAGHTIEVDRGGSKVEIGNWSMQNVVTYENLNVSALRLISSGKDTALEGANGRTQLSLCQCGGRLKDR